MVHECIESWKYWESKNQFELLEVKTGFHLRLHGTRRLVYLMNDALECFLTFRNARGLRESITGLQWRGTWGHGPERSARPW